jgi:hypothetical protein
MLMSNSKQEDLSVVELGASEVKEDSQVLKGFTISSEVDQEEREQILSVTYLKNLRNSLEVKDLVEQHVDHLEKHNSRRRDKILS